MSGVPKDQKFNEESNETIRNVLRLSRAEIFEKEVGNFDYLSTGPWGVARVVEGSKRSEI